MIQDEKSSFEQIATQVVELNLRYYRALGAATMDYVRSMLTFVGDRSPVIRDATARARQAATSVARAATPTAPPAAAPATVHATNAVVLEAAAGEEAAGGFLVNNHLPRRVSAAFRVSPFLGPRGEPFDGALTIDPPMLTLEPGMQAVVRISAMIPATIPPAVDYRGTISIPGLADAPIELVIRRRAETAYAKPSPAAKPRPKTAAKSTRATPRRRN
jgi:hypothetical protein